MEELKDKAGDDAAAEAATGKRKFALPQLSRRTWIIVVAALLVTVIAVGGIVAYLASAKQKEVAAANARKLAEKEAEKAAASKEEAMRIGRESRSAHQSIMEASPLAAEMPVPAKEDKPEPAKAAPTEAGASGKNMLPAPKGAAPETAPAASAAAPPVLPEASKTVAATTTTTTTARDAPDVSAPGASGGCSLAAEKPGDVGKALGRCLEEFNRLEGRK